MTASFSANPSNPHKCMATGFGKWGMTGSMLAAMILSDLVQKKNNEYSTVFSPSRNMLKPQLISNLGHALWGLEGLPQKDPVCFYCMDRCMVFYPETCSPVLPRNSVPLLPGNIPLRYRAVNPSCFFPFQTCDRLRRDQQKSENL